MPWLSLLSPLSSLKDHIQWSNWKSGQWQSLLFNKKLSEQFLVSLERPTILFKTYGTRNFNLVSGDLWVSMTLNQKWCMIATMHTLGYVTSNSKFLNLNWVDCLKDIWTKLCSIIWFPTFHLPRYMINLITYWSKIQA